MVGVFHVGGGFEMGERASMDKMVTEDDIASFARITGDFNPVHMDPVFASSTRFKERIAHGMLSAGLNSALFGTKLPGSGCIYLSQNLRFVGPVRIGDTLTAEVQVTDWTPTKRTIRLNTRCFNQAGEDVVAGEAVVLLERSRV